MKKLLRSTIGTLVVAAFLAIASPMYARGGHGGGHGGHGGHAARGHAAAGQVRGGHAGFHARGGGGNHWARAAHGHARYAGRAYNWNGGRRWGGNYSYPSYGYSRLGYYGSGYGYPYYGSGYYGYRYGGYYPYYGNWGYYPYLYGYWPSVSFSFGYVRSIHHSRNSGRSNAARLLISTSLTSRAARNDCAITELLKTEFLRVLTHNTALQVVPDYRLLGGMLIPDYAKNDRTERTIHAIHFL